jgi:hypothetical protein
MSDATLMALIAEGKAINADIAESMKKPGLAGVGLPQIRAWRDSAAIYIAARDATLGAQVPVIPQGPDTNDIVNAAARTQAMLEALASKSTSASAAEGKAEGFLVLLPKNRTAQRILLGGAGLILVLFAIWNSLPDSRKDKVIDQVPLPVESSKKATDVLKPPSSAEGTVGVSKK